MLLLDTNVLSELRKVRLGRADPRVTAWCAATDPSTFTISVVSLQEVMVGILRLERRDPVQASRYRHWLEVQVIPAFARDGRIWPVDAEVALRCARLHVPDPRPDLDALIAATALVHGLTVATRNRAGFAPPPFHHGGPTVRPTPPPGPVLTPAPKRGSP